MKGVLALVIVLATSCMADVSAQPLLPPNKSEEWIRAMAVTYTARDLHLLGAVKRVVEYDSISRLVPPSSAIDTLPPAVITVLDSSVWEFDRDGNVMSELLSNRMRRFYHDAKGNIDSVTLRSPREADSYMTKRYDANNRLIEVCMFTMWEGKMTEGTRLTIMRNASGAIDSILTNRRAMQPVYAVPVKRRKDGLLPTKLITKDNDADVTLEYRNDATGRLRNVHLSLTMKMLDPVDIDKHIVFDIVFDGTGNLLRKEMQMAGHTFTRTYSYGSHGEMIVFRTDARTVNASSAGSTTIRYKYVYDSHNNWMLRTVTEPPPPPPDGDPFTTDEYSSPVQRSIEYW